MKKTKIFYGNQLVDSTYVGVTRWYVFKYFTIKYTKRTMKVLSVICLMGWSAYFASNYIPRTVYADKEIIKEVTPVSPVMQRIAKCESGNNHYGKDGQVIVHVNKDGTYDQGKYQINSIHNAAAKKMNLNLMVEKDNEAYAMYLYTNEGTGDWYSSRSCWQ